MLVTTRGSRFTIPTRLVLTDSGTSYFLLQKRRLQRIRMLDNSVEYGLQLQDYSAPVLQKLVCENMVRKLELPVADAVKQRQAVIDYTKLLVYGLLYRNSADRARSLVAGSELARKWNSAYPRSPLLPEGVFSSEATASQVAKVLRAKAPAVKKLKAILVEQVRTQFFASDYAVSAQLNRDEREKINTTAQRFVDEIGPELWFLWLYFVNDPASQGVMASVAKMLAISLERASVADYLALMLMELMVRIRNEHGDQVQQDGQGTTTYLVTQLSYPASRRANRARIHLIIATEAGRFHALKTDMDNVDANQRSTLEQFSKAASAGEADLGMYYMSFLQEACNRFGIHFESFASGDRRAGLVNLVLTF